MERVDSQAEDRDLVARTANRPNRKVSQAKAAVAVPARVKAGVAVADRAVARDAVAVKTVDTKQATRYPETKQGGKYHARIRQKRPHGGWPHDRRSPGNLRACRSRNLPACLRQRLWLWQRNGIQARIR